MRGLLGAWRLLRTLVHVVHGVLVVLWVFPSASAATRQARIAWWSAKTLKLLGVTQSVEGQFRHDGVLVVANHISWMDIMAIHAVYPRARFVSKADVKGWPLLNRLVDGGDTLYLERERRRDALRVVHQMAEAIEQGHAVAVFPEGTTGDGRALLPFHANLLQAAIAVAAPIQPVALRYSDAQHRISPAAEFLGETTLAQSVWKIACAQGLHVSLTVLPARASEHADRRRLAHTLRADLAQALGEVLPEP